jgi:hypothetical protein
MKKMKSPERARQVLKLPLWRKTLCPNPFYEGEIACAALAGLCLDSEIGRVAAK